MLSAIAALVVAASAGRATATLDVSARVVASIRAAAPETVALHALASRAAGDGRAHVVATGSARGAPVAVLAGRPGARAERCATGGCDVAVANGGAGAIVVLTFLPDGAPVALLER